MAGLTQTIQTISVIFSGVNDVSGTIVDIKDGVSNLEKDYFSVGDRLKSLATPLASWADDIIKAEALLGGLAAGGLSFAYMKAVELNSAMTGLKKVMGDELPSVIDNVKTSAIELSNTYGISATQILDSITGWKQAGFETHEALSLAEDTLNLVIAGDIEAAEATELLTATLKGFEAPASEAARVVNILNEVSNNYATDTKELGIAMAGISPIAKTMGFTMEETAGLVTPVIEVFRSGSDASMALKTGLLKLIDGSKPVTEALAQLGVAQKDANGNLRSGKDILYDVAGAFKTADENQKLFLTKQLVGIDQSARMVKVFDNMSKSADITATAYDSIGSASEEVAAKFESSEVILNRFKVGFTNLAAAIGGQFEGAANSAIEGVTSIEVALTDAVTSGAFKPLSDALEEILGEIGEKFEEIASVLPEALDKVDFSKLSKAVTKLFGTSGNLVEALFGGDLGTVDGLADAIQIIINGMTILTEASEGVLTGWAPFLGMANKMIFAFSEIDAETANWIGELVGLSKRIEVTIDGLGKLSDIFDSLGGGLVTLLASLAIGITTLVIKMTLLTSGWSGLVTLAKTSVSLFGKLTAAMLGPVGLAAAVGATAYAFGTLINMIPGVSEAVQDLIGAVDEYFGIMDRPKADEAAFERAKQQAQETAEAMRAIEDKKANIEITASGEDAQEIQAILDGTEDQFVNVSADTRNLKAKMAEAGILISKIPDEKITDVKAEADEAAAKKAKEAIEKEIPPEKKMSIQAQLDIAKMKTDAEILTTTLKTEADTMQTTIEAKAATIQSMVEWQAKLDIAEAEASAEKVKAAFESVTATITSTGDVISGIFGAMGNIDTSDRSWKLFYDDMIEQLGIENELRRDAFELQEKLTEAQIDYMNRKAETFGEDIALKVSADGLKPHLEAFMWEIVSTLQSRITEEGAEMLIGLGGAEI